MSTLSVVLVHPLILGRYRAWSPDLRDSTKPLPLTRWQPQQGPVLSHLGPCEEPGPFIPWFPSRAPTPQTVILAEPRSIRPSSPRVFRHAFQHRCGSCTLAVFLSKRSLRHLHTKVPSQPLIQGTSPPFPSPIFSQNRFFPPYSALLLLLIHSPQLPPPSGAPVSVSGVPPPKLTQRPLSEEQRSRTAPCFTSHLCSGGPV